MFFSFCGIKKQENCLRFKDHLITTYTSNTLTTFACKQYKLYPPGHMPNLCICICLVLPRQAAIYRSNLSKTAILGTEENGRCSEMAVMGR